MQKPYRRAIALYLIINGLTALSLTLPLAAILTHFWWDETGGHIYGVWGFLVGAHLLITVWWIPRLATWLGRKDAERAAKRKQKST